jgi:hypothetical protein
MSMTSVADEEKCAWIHMPSIGWALCAAVEAQAATFPPETWRDGEWNLNDYLIESILVGTIETVDGNDLLDEPLALRANP